MTIILKSYNRYLKTCCGGKVNPFHEKTATGLTLCMNSNNTSQPVLRIRLKVVNLFYKATVPNRFRCTETTVSVHLN